MAESLAHLLMRPTHALSSCSVQSPVYHFHLQMGCCWTYSDLCLTSHMAKAVSTKANSKPGAGTSAMALLQNPICLHCASPIRSTVKPYTASCPITGTLNIIRSTKLCGPSGKTLHHPGLPVESLCFGPLKAFHVT